MREGTGHASPAPSERRVGREKNQAERRAPGGLGGLRKRGAKRLVGEEKLGI